MLSKGAGIVPNEEMREIQKHFELSSEEMANQLGLSSKHYLSNIATGKAEVSLLMAIIATHIKRNGPLPKAQLSQLRDNHSNAKKKATTL